MAGLVPDLAPFPDIEELLVAALAEFGTCGSRFPPGRKLAEALPFIRVRRLGGGDDRRTDRPRVDVETAAATRAEAMRVARAIHQRLTSGPVLVPGIGLMDRALAEMGPHEVIDADPHTRHVVATYECHTRRSA